MIRQIPGWIVPALLVGVLSLAVLVAANSNFVADVPESKNDTLPKQVSVQDARVQDVQGENENHRTVDKEKHGVNVKEVTKEGVREKEEGAGEGNDVALKAKRENVEKVEKVDCSTQLCPELTNQLVETVESEGCRSMFVSGKCTVGCLTGLKEVMGNSSWRGCTTQCAGGFADGGAERFLDICESRQGSLLDVGKEAVKSFAGFPTWTVLLALMIITTGAMALKTSGRFKRWGKHARRRSGDSTHLLSSYSSHSSHHRTQVGSVLV